MKKTKSVRKTLKEKLAEEHQKGFDRGYSAGERQTKFNFMPEWSLEKPLVDFVRLVQSWPIEPGGVVALVGTDLKAICNAAIPMRTLRAIADELKRLGYKV